MAAYGVVHELVRSIGLNFTVIWGPENQKNGLKSVFGIESWWVYYLRAFHITESIDISKCRFNSRMKKRLPSISRCLQLYVCLLVVKLIC